MAKKSCLAWSAPVAAFSLLISGCADNVETGMGVSVVTSTSAATSTSTSTSTQAPTRQPATSVPVSEGSAPTATQERGDQPSAEAEPDETPSVGEGNIDAGLFRTSPDGDAFYRFVSPTKNLACGFNLHFWGYDVGCQSPNVPKPDPRVGADPCNEAGVMVNAYSAEHVCVTPLFYGGEPGTRVLEYGQVIRVGDIACKSEVTGMTCIYGPRGFFLSREKVVVF
jgi:hypothetical protein